MKAVITEEIKTFVRNYGQREEISTEWGEPIVGFADAKHPYILNLKNIVSKSHQTPDEVLSEASVIIAYYVPFTRELAQTNRIAGTLVSPEWAQSYEETNAMFLKLNEFLITKIEEMGYQAAVSPETLDFDRQKLISNWSHRHIARAAGLGTFGINNMLITKSGCCGRFHSIITTLDVETDSPLEEEYCLYKKNGSCGVCIKYCPAHALSEDGYDREKCYGVLQKNAKIYRNFGSSYGGGREEEPSGSDVCGKCIVNAPCAFLKIK